MKTDYQTKDMKAPSPSEMKAPTNDGEIYEKNGMRYFDWKGGLCGYETKEQAEAGLKKVSGNS